MTAQKTHRTQILMQFYVSCAKSNPVGGCNSIRSTLPDKSASTDGMKESLSTWPIGDDFCFIFQQFLLSLNAEELLNNLKKSTEIRVNA